MYFSSAVSSVLLIASASAHGINHRSSSNHLQLHTNGKRAGSAPIITTGATGLSDGQVHTRFEISDLAANRPEQWALYIQAMSKYQDAASSNVTGYYSVASIHGVPRQDWDGVSQCDSCSGADGYCPHDSVLFPGWHRAYMALYEQELLGFAYEVANSYAEGCERDTMLKAAATLRIPYWDWAATPDSGNVLPSVISSPQVSFQGPNGQETINNPLYSFAIPDDSVMYYSPFTSWQDTKRWPNSNDASATSQEDSCVSAFDSLRSNIADQVYSLLTVCNDYLHFATDDAGSSSAACSNSLEGIHNTIHTTSGGPGSQGASGSISGGHMTYLPLAAFDPVFWLHHANVDRIFALWQTVHPDSYGASQVAPHNTWTIASGTTQGPDSPLEPFRKDASNFWTTNEVRDWAATFQYTYPEFSTSDGSVSAINAYINALYGQSPSLTASSISKNAETSSNNATSCNNSTSSSSSSVASSATSSAASSGTAPASTNGSVASSASATSTAGVSSVLSGTGAPTSALASSSGFGVKAPSSSGIVTAPSATVPGVSDENPLGSIIGGLTGSLTDLPAEISSLATGMPAEVSSMAESIPSVVSGLLGGIPGDKRTGSSSLDLGASLTGIVPVPTESVPFPNATSTGLAGALATALAGAVNSTAGLLPSFLTPNGSQYEYVCNVHTPRYALNGSYNVYVFDGAPADTSASANYYTDKNLIGVVGVLAGGDMAMANLTIAGSVPMTRYLQNKVRNGDIPSMAEEHCVPYLTQNLNWKVVKEGNEVNVSAISNFKASVFSGSSTPAGVDTLPQWSSLVPQVNVTKGKVGGIQSAPAGYSSGSDSGSNSGSSSSSGSEPCPSEVPTYGSGAGFNSTAPTNGTTAPQYSPSSNSSSSGAASPTNSWSSPSASSYKPQVTSYTGGAAQQGVTSVLVIAAGLIAAAAL